MADDKKKEKPAGWNFDPVEAIVILIFLIAFLGSVIPALINYITSGEISFYGYKLSGIIEFFGLNAQILRALGYVIAGIAAYGVFILHRKGDNIAREQKEKLYPKDMSDIIVATEPVPVKNQLMERWEKILSLSESQNPSDWRLAVIEADIILDELLEKLQLPGDTMGDKLKAVEKSDFTTIEYAWEAHKARNMIAHEGSNFLINQREIRRIISLYQAVFKEFYLI